MNNPVSPLSGKPLSECDDAEVNAWISLRKGYVIKSQRLPYEDFERLITYDKNGNVINSIHYTHDGNAALSLMQSDVWPEYFSLEYQHEYRTAFVTDMCNADLQVSRAATPAAAIARAWLVAWEAKEAEE